MGPYGPYVYYFLYRHKYTTWNLLGFHVASTRLNDLDVKKTSIGYISISQLYVTYREKK